MASPCTSMCRTIIVCTAAVIVAAIATPAGADAIPGLTVEAQRDREKLKHEVDAFVSAAFVKSSESLMRWDHPVCPLVAGLTRHQGEFVLQRVSDIARSANAPLGRETCKANLFVIVAQTPDVFLKLLWRRRPLLFDTRNGVEPVKRFIETPRPVRVWYNSQDIGADGDLEASFSVVLAASAGLGMGALEYPTFAAPSSLGSRLTRQVVRNISSAVVVIDAKQIEGLNFGQLADYIGLVGLAQINLDRNLEQSPPTILRVFGTAGTSPLEMTVWDRALLHSLYSTPQKNRLQLSQMQTFVLKEVSDGSAPP